MTRFCALLVLAAGAVCEGAPIAKSEFRARRAELQKKLEGPLVLFGKTEGRDEVFRTGQEPNFYYLSGFTDPGAILLLTKTEEHLFLPHRNERRELYNGRRVAPEDQNAADLTGFASVHPLEKFEAVLSKALESGVEVYGLAERPESARLKAMAPMRELINAAPLIAGLRVKKSPAEVAAITRATDVTLAAQLAAWKRIQAGAYEYQAVASFTASLLEAGCEGYAYAPIFGSGPNATTLHYNANTRRMDSGELVVIDAGAQCDAYASDVTRTVPVGGKFTPRQREIYEIVLGAHKAAIAAIKPGVSMSDLTKVAREYMNKAGKDSEGNPLGKYLLHGISHHVGLDVHDPGPMVLAPGMVITVEPGIYIRKENIGVRIEDTILVTESGPKNLSAGLPREPDEVEKAMAR